MAFVASSPDKWEVDGDEMRVAHWLAHEPLNYEAVNGVIWPN